LEGLVLSDNKDQIFSLGEPEKPGLGRVSSLGCLNPQAQQNSQSSGQSHPETLEPAHLALFFQTFS
jgi:hypothetical protein